MRNASMHRNNTDDVLGIKQDSEQWPAAQDR